MSLFFHWILMFRISWISLFPLFPFFSIGNIVEMYLRFFPILDSQSCNKYLNEETLHSLNFKNLKIQGIVCSEIQKEKSKNSKYNNKQIQKSIIQRIRDLKCKSSEIFIIQRIKDLRNLRKFQIPKKLKTEKSKESSEIRNLENQHWLQKSKDPTVPNNSKFKINPKKSKR